MGYFKMKHVPASVSISIADWLRKHGHAVRPALTKAERAQLAECFALMDGESRTQLTTAVRAWLLSDISMDINMEKEDLTEEDLVSMEDQVTRAWWKEHLTSKASPSPSLSPAP